MNNNLVNFDIYSKRISFFFNNNEKIGTIFGFIYTIMYILISLAIFINYLVYAVKRKNAKIYDSTSYSKNIPEININPNILYFAFGLENPKTSNRFIDESIYYPRIFFLEKIKVNGQFITTEKKELEYEICKEENFGEDYKNLLDKRELNNSYCLKDYNLTLSGGYNYNQMTNIIILIYPCKNNTGNNRQCKSQEIIDSYIKRGIFSIKLKDISLDPHNYSFPVLPSLQNYDITIDSSIYKDFIIYYGITEIKTDTGLFNEREKTQKYLKLKNKFESFYLRNDLEYNNGSEVISVDLRIDQMIFTQKRIYQKIPEIFSIIGGYMQLLNIIFSLLSLLINNILPELKILNGIFDFNLNQKKMTMKIHTIKDFNSLVFKKTLYIPSDKQAMSFDNSKPPNNNNNNNNVSKNNLMGVDNTENNSSQVNIINRKHNSLIIIRENEKENEKSSNFKQSVFNDQQNELNLKKNNNSNANLSKNYIYRVGSFYPKFKATEKQQSNNILKEYNAQIHFNIFDYYLCCNKCIKRKKDIELFKLGLSLYKKRMDIINVFTLLLFSEKNCLQAEEFYY